MLKGVESMGFFEVFYQFMDHFAFLVLSAVGLAIIFGMMGIINLAHGEFIMLGAYTASLAVINGVPFIFAIVLSVIVVSIIGFILDKLIISKLYGRTIDSVVVTFGISMVLGQLMLIIFGPSMQSPATPFGAVIIFGSSYSLYRICLFFVAVLVLIFIYWLFMHTRFGLLSRATIQKNDIAKSLGVNTEKYYSLTFVLGSALAGLTGALYAATMTVSPTFGNGFLTPSFVTVIVGGANALIGTVMSGAMLGVVNTVVDYLWGTLYGRLSLLVVTILVIRLLPLGLSGFVESKILKVRGK